MTNRFVRNCDTTFGKEFLHITQTQRESMVKSHGITDYFGRESVTFVAGFHVLIVAEHADCALS